MGRTLTKAHSRITRTSNQADKRTEQLKHSEDGGEKKEDQDIIPHSHHQHHMDQVAQSTSEPDLASLEVSTSSFKSLSITQKVIMSQLILDVLTRLLRHQDKLLAYCISKRESAQQKLK